MSIESQLKAFAKTDKFKRLVAEKMKNNPNFGFVTYHNAATSLGDKMKDILREEILNIKSSTTGESFLDHIIVNEEFVPDTGWTINVSFDEEFMHRDSLYPEGYPEGAELNVLFNEGYSARAYAYGIDRHGEATYSRRQRNALYFVQRAVDRFNAEQKGKAVAQYNSKYTGGTL